VAASRIFICYRRETGAEAARVVREALRQRGLPVFMDVEDLRSGQYTRILTSQIEECSDFILVLTQGSLDRCGQPGDWVTREIAEALRLGKNIVPLCFEELAWPEPLPAEIAPLREFQVCKYSREYHRASIERLIQCLEARPRWTWPVARSGRVAALLAVVGALALGGYYLVPALKSKLIPPSGVFSQPFLLQWAQGTNEPMEWGEVGLQLTIDKNFSGGPVQPDGRVNVELPAKARGKPASVSLSSEEWLLLSGRDIRSLDARTHYLKVEHKPFTVQGSVKNADHLPIKNVEITLSSAGLSTHTDSDGEFAFSLPGSSWRPRMELLATNLEWISATVEIPRGTNLVLSPILLREAPPFTQDVVLSGPANASEMTDLSRGGARLVLTNGDLKLEKRSMITQGKAQFTDLAPSLLGAWAGVILRSEGWQLKEGQGRLSFSTQPVQLKVERKGKRISGRVVDFEAGKPVADALVSVGDVSTNSNAEGAFDLFVPKAPLGASFSVSASKEDWTTTTLTNADITRPLEIRLRRPEPFGQVLGLDLDNGGPASVLEGATLQLTASAITWKASVDKEGQAQFLSLPRSLLNQTGIVAFADEGWRLKPGEERLRLTTNPAVLTVEQTGVKVTGRVLDGDGLGVNGASVSIEGRSAATDAQGAFRVFLPGMPPPARWQVTVTNAGWQSTNFTTAPLAGSLEIPLTRAPSLNPLPLETKPVAETPTPSPTVEKAESELKAGTAASPQSANAALDYGAYLLNHERPSEAFGPFTQAKDLALRQGQRDAQAAALNGLGLVYDRLNRPREALDAFGAAVSLFRDLAKTDSKEQQNLATSLWNRGEVYRSVKEFRAALADDQEALKVLRGLPHPDRAVQAEIARTEASIGWAEFNLTDRTGALVAFEAAMTDFRAAGAEDPQSPARLKFAGALNRYAIYTAAGSDPSRAGALYEQAIAGYKDAARVGNAPAVEEEMAATLKNAGIYYFDAGDMEKARERYREALAGFKALAKKERKRFAPQVAETQTSLAAALAELKDDSGARQLFNEAIELSQQLAQDGSPAGQETYANALFGRARFLNNQGQEDAARADYEQSANLYQDLLRSGSTNDFALRLCNYAVFLQQHPREPRDRDIRAAEQAYRAAMKIYNGRGDDAGLAATCKDLGVLFYNAENLNATSTNYAAAVEVANRLWKKNRLASDGARLCGYYLDVAGLDLDFFDDHPDQAGYRKRAHEALAAAQDLKKKLSSSPAIDLSPLQRRVDDLKNRLDGKSP